MQTMAIAQKLPLERKWNFGLFSSLSEAYYSLVSVI